MERTVLTPKELEGAAKEFVETLLPRPESATLVTLSGELGAGKTAFTKAVAKALGIEDVVNSPTFVLEKIYALPAGKKFQKLVHIDAYRLHGGQELAPLGFEEIMKESGNLVFLEWPEQVANGLPVPAKRIFLKQSTEDARLIRYE